VRRIGDIARDVATRVWTRVLSQDRSVDRVGDCVAKHVWARVWEPCIDRDTRVARRCRYRIKESLFRSVACPPEAQGE
jgi:hypothetical protein